MVVALVVSAVMAGGCSTHRLETNVMKTGSGLQIVSFNQDLTTLEVLQKMDAAMLEPAALEEIMKEPKRATADGGLIYALGSAGTISLNTRVCYMVPGCSDRDPVMGIVIKIDCDPEFKWPAGANFGAMPK